MTVIQQSQYALCFATFDIKQSLDVQILPISSGNSINECHFGTLYLGITDRCSRLSPSGSAQYTLTNYLLCFTTSYSMKYIQINIKGYVERYSTTN